MARALLVALAAASLAGCGSEADGDDDGSGGHDDERCSLSVKLGGAIDETLDYDLGEGCSGSSSDSSTAVSFGFVGDKVNFAVYLTGSLSGPFSEGWPASVNITSADGNTQWSTPDDSCVAFLTTVIFEGEDEIGKSYSLGGNGTCSANAVDEAGSAAAVTIGPFEFRAETLAP